MTNEHLDEYDFLNSPLFPQQQLVCREILTRITNELPTILYAGSKAGKSTICRELSKTLRVRDQMGVSREARVFSDFNLSIIDDHASPMELPLRYSSATSVDYDMWDRISPDTIVFIDDVFNLPDGEELFDRICTITPYVIAMGNKNGIGKAWVHDHSSYYVGPYASWELNELLDYKQMRNDRRYGSRKSFNAEYAACGDLAWKPK